MTYTEIKGDLFSAPKDYYLVHCISSDFALGAGIAKQFAEKFDMKQKLIDRYPNYSQYFQENNLYADCLFVDRVFNLVTKHYYWEKPTYYSLEVALKKLLFECIVKNITKLAMPKIGCGLDRLEWEKVSEMIQNIFKSQDVSIIVYYI